MNENDAQVPRIAKDSLVITSSHVALIAMAMSLAAAIMFGLYVENEKNVFKELTQAQLKEKIASYDKLQAEYIVCSNQLNWNSIRKNVREECKSQVTHDSRELEECKRRLNDVKDSISEFVEHKNSQKQCEGAWCGLLNTVAGVFHDATGQ